MHVARSSTEQLLGILHDILCRKEPASTTSTSRHEEVSQQQVVFGQARRQSPPAHPPWGAQSGVPRAQSFISGAQSATPGAQSAIPGAQSATYNLLITYLQPTYNLLITAVLAGLEQKD